ncbi:MAG: DEAD/DEAH box helicase family protein [Oligoflexia bacterium]|nr:DEAD/DEAH box helicase family protein [Oligoflexia bacterium]
MSKEHIQSIEERLRILDSERKVLAAELITLRSKELVQTRVLLGISARAIPPSTPDDKIELFLSLFRCRESVYPRLWENQKQGKKGYAPACRNEWVRSVCEKPKIKCSDCPNQAFLPLDNVAVKGHLQGTHTIGTYAIRQGDTCIFLAADFDGEGWEEDVLAYKQVAQTLGVEIAVERSRSGNGAHCWIFFRESVPARIARQLGTLLVSRAVELRHSIKLSTYDRFFPNQDYLPNDGFGNLIALPLQKIARDAGNSVFIDEAFQSFEDQWIYLSQVKRLSNNEVVSILEEYLPERNTFSLIPEINALETDERIMKVAKPKLFKGLYTGNVEIELGSQLSIKLADLPGPLVTALKRTATFANPKFYELERMRFSTYPHSRFIFCGDVQQDTLVLPRGVLDQCIELAQEVGAQTIIRDIRLTHKKMKTVFNGELQPEQKKALNKIIENDTGVLLAPPGSGKTVIACALIAKRKLPTLILVHRQPLLDQWKEQIHRFLDVPIKEIGTFASSKKKLTGKIDIAMIQTLTKTDEIEELLSGYSQVIVDECHHIPAVSFESLLKRISSKYILGLTATPYRKDGHHKILFMQCGPIRYEIKSADNNSLSKRVVVHETTFQLSAELGHQPPIHVVWEKLTADQERNNLIVEDITSAIHEGRFPLVISDRKEHLEQLADKTAERNPNIKVFRLEGTLGKKARRQVFDEISLGLETKVPQCLFATASLIGEGVDIPRLDTLVLAMPISFKGRMVQYAGRLHRPFPGKKDVLIYDYLDSCSGLTISMYRKRLLAYKSMGYQIHSPERSFGVRSVQSNLFAKDI